MLMRGDGPPLAMKILSCLNSPFMDDKCRQGCWWWWGDGPAWQWTDYRAQTLPLWMMNVVNEDDGTTKKMRASTRWSDYHSKTLPFWMINVVNEDGWYFGRWWRGERPSDWLSCKNSSFMWW
jgi:hypothetical protein